MNLPQCAREGCQERIPLAAWLAVDRFCSTVCVRLDLGLITTEQAVIQERQREAMRHARKQQAGWYGATN